ncbi:MAG: hypothetical protein ABI054_00480 [Planctomycetota bacterium]
MSASFPGAAAGGGKVELKAWDTPFSDLRSPLVNLLTEYATSSATIVVEPISVDRYPKYLVRFSAVYAFMSEEEGGGTADIVNTTDSSKLGSSCAWIWVDSPHSAGYESWGEMRLRGGSGPIVHYLIFGIDNNVGVVAGDVPSIERVDGPRSLDLNYQL